MELEDALKKLKAKLKHNPAGVADEKHEAGESETFTGLSPTISVLSFFCDKPDWLYIWQKMELEDALKKLKAKLKHNPAGITAEKHEAALMIVCAFINVAKFCKIKLQAWSNDVLLLGLGIDENGMNNDINGHMMETSGFFDEEIKSLSELETSWLMEMIAHILRQFETL
ncbi:hypothetical protein Nepgr_022470 [Nepenthes gracilis]|uniref:Uncharacterized protein n=1 Tax=Nepenthes gracilis TaxID=150966 RepID=A0AAD3T104_NEPGR|nr:hypothetical protein Nepgr_022470 [Nepenthes gracilis]